MTWNLADLFESVADRIPDREAVVVPNADGGPRRFTFAQLDERSNRLAHALLERGVKPGDKVGIYGYNGNEWVETQWAAWKIRAIPVNVNYRYVEHELSYLLENADAVAVVHGAEFSSRLAVVRDQLPLLRTCLAYQDGTNSDIGVSSSSDYEEALAAASADRDFEPRRNDDLYIVYTGGTTGMPKGVLWSHEDLFKATIEPVMTSLTEPIVAEWEVAERASDPSAESIRALPVAPLMHGAGQWASIVQTLNGGPLILSTARSMDAGEVWSMADEEKAVVMSIVGDAQARPLMDELAKRIDDLDLSSLLFITSGGAILSPAVKAQIVELLPNVFVFDALGASETGYQGTGYGADGSGRPQFRMGDNTLVIDDQGNPTTPGDGVVGRLVRRGHLPLGYYKDERKTEETFPIINGDRYVVPGDMAVAEADGTVTLLGRGSVSINSGGEKIFPEEVELALKEHPDVFDAVVVGVPDERWGEHVVAVVQAREGTNPTLEAVQEAASTLIARYKLPRELVLVDKMVRSPSGKADYRWAKSVAMEHSGSS